MKRPGVLVGAALSLTLVACGAAPSPSPAPPATGAVTGSPLAATPAEGLLAPDEALPVLRVERDRLAVGELVVRLDGFTAPEVFDGGLLIRSLGDGLTALRDARRIAGVEARAESIALSIHPEAPYALVTRVLYTTGYAGFGDMDFLVSTPDGLRRVHIPLPRVVRADPDADIEHSGACSSAESRIAADRVRVFGRRDFIGDGPVEAVSGVDLGASSPGEGLAAALGSDTVSTVFDSGSDGGAGLAATLGGDPPGAPVGRPPPPTWRDSLVITASGACPSSPRRDGRVDRAGLARLLERVYAVQPGCTKGMVTADEAVVWQDLADVLQLYVARGARPMLMVSPGAADAVSCADAYVLP